MKRHHLQSHLLVQDDVVSQVHIAKGGWGQLVVVDWTGNTYFNHHHDHWHNHYLRTCPPQADTVERTQQKILLCTFDLYFSSKYQKYLSVKIKHISLWKNAYCQQRKCIDGNVNEKDVMRWKTTNHEEDLIIVVLITITISSSLSPVAGNSATIKLARICPSLEKISCLPKTDLLNWILVFFSFTRWYLLHAALKIDQIQQVLYLYCVFRGQTSTLGTSLLWIPKPFLVLKW